MSDRTIKRLWLFQLFFSPLFFGWVFVFLLKKCGPLFPLNFGRELGRITFEHFWAALVSIPFFYYWAYKRKGTVLLTISIWLSVTFWLGELSCSNGFWKLVGAMENLGFKNVKELSTSLVIVAVLRVALQFLWMMTCIALRKINWRERFIELKNSEAYKNLFLQMESMENRAALTAFYGQSVRENPQIERFLKRAYKERLALCRNR